MYTADVFKCLMYYCFPYSTKYNTCSSSILRPCAFFHNNNYNIIVYCNLKSFHPWYIFPAKNCNTIIVVTIPIMVLFESLIITKEHFIRRPYVLYARAQFRIRYSPPTARRTIIFSFFFYCEFARRIYTTKIL